MIAHARHTGLVSSTIVIEHGGKEYNLKPGGMLSGKFSLFEGDQRVGDFTVKSKNFMADLPQDIPLPVRTFILWIMLLIRMAAAAGK